MSYPSDARRFWPPVLVVVAVAAVARSPGLDARGLSSDEAVYLQQGVDLVHGGAWVRAHPPLFGVLLQVVPGLDGDVGARTVSVGLGLASVVVAALLGRELAGTAAGVLAAVLLAAMPYHADVTRLALVDVPMATTAGLGVLLAVRHARSGRQGTAVAAAAVLAVAVLFKEAALLTALSVLAVALWREPRMDRHLLRRCVLVHLAILCAYPLTLAWRGSLGSGAGYLGWQLERGPTEPAGFYLTTVLPRVGAALLVGTVVGAVLLLHGRRRGADLVVASAAGPVAFLALWPVRGYPYLLMAAVPASALAAAAVVLLARAAAHRWRPAAVLVVATSLAVAGATRASAAPPDLPGASGVPGIRETARWISGHGTQPVVTGAPWVSSVLRHYLGAVPVQTLAGPVSDAALNPAYRGTGVRTLPSGPSLVVWDVWSAAADPAGTARLLDLVRERDGRVVHVESATTGGSRRVALVTFEVAR